MNVKVFFKIKLKKSIFCLDLFGNLLKIKLNVQLEAINHIILWNFRFRNLLRGWQRTFGYLHGLRFFPPPHHALWNHLADRRNASMAQSPRIVLTPHPVNGIVAIHFTARLANWWSPCVSRIRVHRHLDSHLPYGQHFAIEIQERLKKIVRIYFFFVFLYRFLFSLPRKMFFQFANDGRVFVYSSYGKHSRGFYDSFFFLLLYHAYVQLLDSNFHINYIINLCVPETRREKNQVITKMQFHPIKYLLQNCFPMYSIFNYKLSTVEVVCNFDYY